MREYPTDRTMRELWKKSPLRIVAHSLSSCCQAPMLVAQTMERGFVKCYCVKCRKDDTLSEMNFLKLHLWVACPDFKKQMQPPKGARRHNYTYQCTDRDWEIKLATLLPRAEDVV